MEATTFFGTISFLSISPVYACGSPSFYTGALHPAPSGFAVGVWCDCPSVDQTVKPFESIENYPVLSILLFFAKNLKFN